MAAALYLQEVARHDAAPARSAPGSSRLAEFDVLRGFLLLWMTLTHLPTRVSAFSNQTVGYVSAAEGFIFLAAFLTGQVQWRAQQKYGPAGALRRLLRRALRIYKYHVALLAAAFVLGGAAAVYLQRVPLQNLLDFYLLRPKLATMAAAALVYNPPLLDILPLYIAFTLATPLLLWMAEKWNWGFVLAGSGLIWLLAQLHLREWLYAAVAQRGFPVPLNETGAFDLFAWQLLWTIGLALGTASPNLRLSRSRISGKLLAASAGIAGILFVCRHSPFEALTGPALFGVLVDKWKLGFLRLVDFAAIGVLVVRFGPALANTRWAMRLAPLGRASIQVFSLHVLFCLMALSLSQQPDPHYTWWQDIIILATTMAGLFWIAGRAERGREEQKQAPGRRLLRSAA